MAVEVRNCEVADLAAVIDILQARRAEHERYEPVFWKISEDAAASSKAFLATVLEDEESLCLVAMESGILVGFLFARPMPTPPVYDAGPTAVIDDFYMLSPDRWITAGVALIENAKQRLSEKGIKQIVAVSAYKDNAKMVFLRQQGLSLASAWFTSEI
ncbi:N-acetyltransferase [Devosia pacifica]|uniref:N-acetyltransferase n=1 Tax=Devosia pacifica TaxID=1335967 RepID=A0A918VMB2_9HYPH|nr:GNAT family N-acetyltransferase [Devosia pacifica]GHA12702.1 N-acetyltransferase [Devosia pacifica]